jgi:multicomponent Na+:H+ antiporter subunit C
MAILLAGLVGILYAAGVYMMLRRSLVKVIIGLGLLAHGANLLIFTSGGLKEAVPPIIPPGDEQLDFVAASDPLPQALILTAIVIGFGVTAYALVLFHRAYQAVGADDLDDLKSTDT